jgi:manganese-dependent ADP-ribose/CDP-alcohol diphosphatase
MAGVTDDTLNGGVRAGTVSFGVIADVQYADAPDGSDFKKTVVRRYRNSLNILKAAVEDWMASKETGGIKMVLQLGDLLDGRCAKIQTCDKMNCLKSVLDVLEKIPSNVPRFDLIGNHELYLFAREQLNDSAKSPLQSARLDPVLGTESTWYSYVVSPGFRVVVLDAYDISTLNGARSPQTEEAFKYLEQHNPNDTRRFGVDWTTGLSGLDLRNVPYNGSIGNSQLEWLAETLVLALESNEKCVLASHVSFIPGSNSMSCVVWNYQEVLDVLWNPRGWKAGNGNGKRESVTTFSETPVIACMYGHSHKGGSCVDPRGIVHITFQAPLEAVGDSVAYATVHVDLVEGKMIVDGKGSVPSRTCGFPPIASDIPSGGVTDAEAVQYLQEHVDGLGEEEAKAALSEVMGNRREAIARLKAKLRG